MPGLVPAHLEYDAHGVPCSRTYGDVYHSADGGPGQARHVFLAGNRLPARWQDRERFVILETGFGTGLNFLSTWAAWQDDSRACTRLHYLSVEKHPFGAEDLARLHAAWPQFSALAAALHAAWPCLTPGFHRLEFAGGRLLLTLLLGDAEDLLTKLSARADAFFLDGFAPAKNPELWSPRLLYRLGCLAGDGATLATWSVSGAVRDALHRAGFSTEKIAGYGHKREMLTGHRAQRLQRSTVAPAAGPAERRAVVIGAGLAGAACCERLATRGWDLTLIDRQRGPAMAASGNPAGLLMPLVARDDSIASRLSRAAFLHTLETWRCLAAKGAVPCFSGCGVLQIARDARQEQRQREVVEALRFPAEFMRYLDRDQASSWLGQSVAAGAWLFPRAGWANPPSVCRAGIEVAGNRVRTAYDVEASALRRQDGVWQVRDGEGRVLAEAPVVIFALGAQSTAMPETAPLPIQAIRGQVSLIPAGGLPHLRAALCREGYVIPAVDGFHVVGASYGPDDDARPRRICDLDNLRRLDNLLPGIGASIDPATLSSRVGFRPVATDRLPVVGALPDWPTASELDAAKLRDLPRAPGLHCLLGYASRGLAWAALMAETLACQLEGEPLPLETDLLRAVDPARFLRKQLRRKG